jgi:hypothetical protein
LIVEDYDLKRPRPPAILYKYVVADRLDILRNGNIRFTPPLNTNDIFEVRQTFGLLAGPKMQAMFEERLQAADIDKAISDALVGTPLAGLTVDEVKAVFSAATGHDIAPTIHNWVLSALRTRVYPAWNSPQAIDSLLTDLGGSLMGLSLAERFDSSPMWAHYADNSAGFVIAFDTAHEFFKRGDEGDRQGLHKITYFDGQIAELMDDPYAALISKQRDWSYEREWRLCSKVDQASRTIGTDDQTIHLVDFPKQAVQRVILGLRADDKLQSSISEVLARDYPHATLTRISTDAATSSFKEVSVSTTE